MKKITSEVHGLSRFEFVAMMAAIMALNALAIDIMLPALPNMGEALNVINENDRSLVITFYLVGVGASQIFLGPLSDRFGRRIPLFIGLAIYIITAFAAILAPTFGILLAFRLMQGMGAAATRLIVTAMMRDCYSGNAMAEVMALVFTVFMIMPIIAPGIGQIIMLLGPWENIYLFVGGLGLVVTLWAVFRMPETLAVKERRPLKISIIADGFKIIFSNRIALGYAMAGTFIFGMMFSFVNTAQQIYVGIFELGTLFPVAFAATAVLQAISSYINSRVVGKYGMRRIAHTGIVIFIISNCILLFIASIGPMSFWVFYSLICTNMFVFSWIASNTNTLSMQPLGKLAGTASGVFGTLQTIFGALLAYFISQMFDGTLVPVAFGFLAMGIGALVSILYAEQGKLFRKGREEED